MTNLKTSRAALPQLAGNSATSISKHCNSTLQYSLSGVNRTVTSTKELIQPHPLNAITPPVLLPYELWDEIMEDVISSPHDLLNLRRVNKVFCDFAARVAFREIVVHTTEKSAQGFLELLVRPDITEHIRGVRIIEDPGECRLVSLRAVLTRFYFPR